MIKQFFKISLYSFVTFCVISFISFTISVIYNKITGGFPGFKIGFPVNFYYQFPVKCCENCYDMQHGSSLLNIIYNFVIFWIIVFLYFIFKKNKKHN